MSAHTPTLAMHAVDVIMAHVQERRPFSTRGSLHGQALTASGPAMAMAKGIATAWRVRFETHAWSGLADYVVWHSFLPIAWHAAGTATWLMPPVHAFDTDAMSTGNRRAFLLARDQVEIALLRAAMTVVSVTRD